MTDIWDAEKRSWVMSRIRSRDTKPERVVRSILHRLGYRFTVNGPLNKSLPGKPDIVLPKWGTVVFVHGCFWHAHSGCKDFRIPRTRTDWWEEKLLRNRRRDRRSTGKLRREGWKVVIVWACEMRNLPKLEKLVGRLAVIDGRAWDRSGLDAEPTARVAEAAGKYRTKVKRSR